ncbi:4'-phosphopantetheinyl transferase superfamily protein [uncultured Tateyamaria sp.]|uniref:4'-phosphopantetheinyl transferase family protein n=1 Tax=uncultured Tateyamaria sp. TaxID=455651 RepID=UPI00261D1857|nr:4'-phosphopantetheinyl transferase superfamily protein [uncultured Tateyamaria sp.]
MFISDDFNLEPPHGAEVFAGCRFDVSAFEPELFDQMNIIRPPEIAGAVGKRQAEFLAGRYLVQRGLAQLGVPEQSVGTGAHRQPLWPPDVSGAITHADGVAVVLMSSQPTALVGVDVETVLDADMAATVAPQVLSNSEKELLQAATGSALETLTAVFSAKETLFKALFPLVGRYFGFEAAELNAPPEQRRISLALTQDLSPGAPRGRVFDIAWRLHDGQVLTWLVES